MLVYTDKKPTKPGWYWLRKQWTKEVKYEQVRHILESTEGLVVEEGDFTYPVSSEGCNTTLWAGPIDKPMTVEEYHIGGYIT